jgi:hypothetical protein
MKSVIGIIVKTDICVQIKHTPEQPHQINHKENQNCHEINKNRSSTCQTLRDGAIAVLRREYGSSKSSRGWLTPQIMPNAP